MNRAFSPQRLTLPLTADVAEAVAKEFSGPAVLYQYLSDPTGSQTCDLLARRRFKLSFAGDLNDPFDMVPFLEQNRPEDVRRYLESTRGRFGSGFIGPVQIAAVKARIDTAVKNPIEEWPKKMKRSRLLCLSSRDDGVLLWSHYASRHRGFAVGFHAGALIKSHPIVLPFEVEYKDERVKFSVCDFIDHDHTWGVFQKLLSRKSREWSYEREWRSLLHENDVDGGLYLSFAAEAVACIILGSRISRESEAVLREACREGGIANFALKRADLSREHFQVAISPTKWRA